MPTAGYQEWSLKNYNMERLIVDYKECIGCDLCVDMCPELFVSTAFVPLPTNKDVSGNICARDSVELCPVYAISIIKVEN